MSSEHEVLIRKYQEYKNEVAEYDKMLYAYNTQIESYAKDIISQIGELKASGVDLGVLKKYAKEDGSIDLTDIGVVKGMISDLYQLYSDCVEEGLNLIDNR